MLSNQEAYRLRVIVVPSQSTQLAEWPASRELKGGAVQEERTFNSSTQPKLIPLLSTHIREKLGPLKY